MSQREMSKKGNIKFVLFFLMEKNKIKMMKTGTERQRRANFSHDDRCLCFIYFNLCRC